ncbi:MAG: RsiV family protein [Janthinobacterium lividum]
MNARRFLLPGLALLASCQSVPEKPPAHSAVPKGPDGATAVPSAAHTRDNSAAGNTAPFIGFHRYRGTVGGQAVTLELTVDRGNGATAPLVCQGNYAYDRHPTGLLLLQSPRPYQPGQPLHLTEADSARPGMATGDWQAAQPAGAVLTGTWRSPAGQALPFRLREDYTDGHGNRLAVAYEVLGERVTGPPCRPERIADESAAEYRVRTKDVPPASLDRQFLHLLGPDTLQPALRWLQCPPPGQRRRAMRTDLREAGACANVTDGLAVTYLGHGLLATRAYHEVYYQGTAHPSHDVDAAVYDLRTGQALGLAEVLRPGTDPALRRLVTPALQREMGANGYTDPEVLAPAEGDTATTKLPATGFGMSAEGLTFQYTDYELGAYAYGMPLVTIPWAAAQPLLRPSSPVARMLRERGLWPTRK